MLTMSDMPWPSVGQRVVKHLLIDDILLTDDFHQTGDKVVKAGEEISLWVADNVGIITHAVYGHFHYLKLGE